MSEDRGPEAAGPGGEGGEFVFPHVAAPEAELDIRVGVVAVPGATTDASTRTPTPAPTPTRTPTPTTRNYTIKSGDTLSELAQRHKTTVAELVKLNDIKDPDKIIASVNQCPGENPRG